MKGNRGIFVKVNYKNIGELNSFIYDSMNGVNKNKDKYVMCAGKYNKDGWTMVFKAKSIREAEELLRESWIKRSIYYNHNYLKMIEYQFPLGCLITNSFLLKEKHTIIYI